MLQADIAALEHRQQLLEHQLLEALRHSQSDHLIRDLKSRALFVSEEIERLRFEEILLSH